MRIARPTAIKELLKTCGLLAVVAAAGFVVTYQYVGEPPPSHVRIATGPTDGAYFDFGHRYAQLLAEDGITLEVVETAGSAENLDRLKRGDVSLALVQGGSATVDDREHLESLGGLFVEAVWVFTRSETRLHRLSELEGKRVGVGATGSGTHLLAMELLTANGIGEANAELVRAETGDAAGLVASGGLDAAIFVAAAEAPYIRRLLETPGIALGDLERSSTYDRLFSFLTPVVLSEGVVNLERNIPPTDARLVAASASLAARTDLHPGLIPALLDAVTKVHAPGGVLERRRQFPSVDVVDLPMNSDASRYIQSGPSFLYRWLPYGTAVRLDRLKLLLLPLVALLIPLIRLAPPLYQWRIRSRIYRWYAEVRDIDMMLLSEPPADAEPIAEQLRTLEREVASVSVPLAYAGEQYHLRLHIRFLQERLAAARPQRTTAATSESAASDRDSRPLNGTWK